ncbi:MAG: family 10 glycosylhydrolase [Bacteroidota bacterium]
MKYSSLSIIIFLAAVNFFAQVERETRAVWLATNHRLDWPPPTYNAEKQKQALTDIFDNLKVKNFNTVYFQARSIGTVMFNSSFEPFSQYLTGSVGKEPSFDPLKFAIEEAHKRGIEIHAWINACLVNNGTDSAVLKNKNHISQTKPEWIVEDVRDRQKSLWIDPGLPEARNYLVDLILEMVENYDVDGVHLDYIRYPGKNFDDDFSYKIHGSGLSRDEFRRKNITAIVEDVYQQVKAVKPFVKIGAAPIGVYKSLAGMKALESFYDLYQDSYSWMKMGIVDYLTPQIYWGLDENPRFDLLAKDWKDNEGESRVVLGIGAYKDNVKENIEDMILLARKIKADGVSFFRYQHIKDINFPAYKFKVFPAAIKELNEINPSSPSNLTAVLNADKKHFSLKWTEGIIESGNDSASYYSVYNLPNSNTSHSKEFLFDVVAAPRNSLMIAVDKPKKVNYFFALKSVNKLWNESTEATNTVKVQIPLMKELAELNRELIKPLLIKESDNSALIIIESGEGEQVELFGGKGKELFHLGTKTLSIGKNVLVFPAQLKNYDRVKIVFGKTQKEVVLQIL